MSAWQGMRVSAFQSGTHTHPHAHAHALRRSRGGRSVSNSARSDMGAWVWVLRHAQHPVLQLSDLRDSERSAGALGPRTRERQAEIAALDRSEGREEPTPKESDGEMRICLNAS